MKITNINKKQAFWAILIVLIITILVVVIRVLIVPWPPLSIAKAMLPKNTSAEKIKQLEFAYNEVKTRPFNSYSWNSLGTAWYSIGNIKMAISSYREAITMGNDAWLPTLNLARVLIGEKQNDEALSLLREAHKIRPDNLSICFEYGDLLRRLYFPERADELGQMYIECVNAKDDAALKERIAILYIDLGKYKEALDVYEKLNKQFEGQYRVQVRETKKLLGIK